MSEWRESILPIDLGDYNHRVGWRADGELYWGHQCIGRYQLGWCDVVSGQHHIVLSREPITIQGSLLCTTCGDHGWVRDNIWVPV